MTAARTEALEAAKLTDSERLSALEEPLRNAQVLASLLARVIGGMERWPSMSKIEQMVACEELDFVTEPLKNAIYEMDAIYHHRTEEEDA
jgi:hypothetical protein